MYFEVFVSAQQQADKLLATELLLQSPPFSENAPPTHTHNTTHDMQHT